MGSAIKSVTNAVGSAFGFGGGNTVRFDPSRFAYNPDAKSFGPINQDIEGAIQGVRQDNRNAVLGIDQRTYRDKQTALAEALEAQARGEGPSLAQNQLRKATERNLQDQMALAASARGNVNPALMQRQLMQNQAATNQAAAQQSADLRFQELMAARQMLGDLATNARNQDAAAQQYATEAERGMLDQIAGIRDSNRAAAMNLESLRSNNALGVGNQAVQDTINRRDTRTQMHGALISGIASGASAGLGGPAGGAKGGATPKYDGGLIPGRAKVPGDSPANDTVPAMLSPDEVVLPRSVVTPA
ncbi:MAG: hypothetical protein AB7G93_15210 [Bdellovibrionales bacterium]